MKLIFTLLVFTIFSSCTDHGNNEIKEKYENALMYSQKNKIQLEKVITHYSKNRADSLKLEAAYYLIGNMAGKGYYEYQAFDSRGNNLSFDMFIYGSADSAFIEKTKLEKRTNCTLAYIPTKFIEDLTVISAEQIIENIDYAFKTYELPWVKSNISFDIFKEYILPHRIKNEPLQNWRKDHYNLIKEILKNVNSNESYLRIASIINDTIAKKYKYIHEKINYYPGQFSVKEMRTLGGGRCEDLNMILGYMLRAAGIPCAHEFTPFWGTSNYGGHSWLSVYNVQSTKFVPMNAVYNNPVAGSLPFGGARLAKAFRSQYGTPLEKKTDEEKTRSFLDITNEYLPVSQLEIKVNVQGKKVFLGVLNGQDWKPIDSAVSLSGNTSKFQNIANNVLYCPIVFDFNQSTIPVGLPFLLDKKGKIHQIRQNPSKLTTVRFRVQSLSKRLYKNLCQVIYFDENTNTWNKTGEQKILEHDPKDKNNQEKTISFNGVVADALYRVILSNVTMDKQDVGRPFLFDPNIQSYDDY